MTRRESKDRRLGWCPPPQIQVSIAVETYKYIKQAAADKDQRSCPIYDTLQSIIQEFEQSKELKEDLEMVRELLAVAMEDKAQLRKENEMMRENLVQVQSIN
jgi:hypothetical protein